VGIVSPSYGEHGHSWSEHGHEVVSVERDNLETASDFLDVLVVCNPNNPTAHFTPIERLLECHKRLSVRGGWLVVDEAFIDCTPELSIRPYLPRNGLILLRSLGKYFGLAGTRVGFVVAHDDFLTRMEEWLGPWTIAGPSRWAAKCALLDRDWQIKNTAFLKQASDDLLSVLHSNNLIPSGSTTYFHWIEHDKAKEIHFKLAQRGILTRLFLSPRSIRFGVASSKNDLLRLDAALKEVCDELSA